MKIAIFAAMAISTMSAAAFADDRADVLNCIQKAEKKDKAATPCIGLIADACIAKTENGSKGDPKACAKRELAVWSNLLREAVKLVEKGGFQEIISTMTESQQAWMNSREKLCPTFDVVDPGMALGGADYCRVVETGGRVVTLRKLGNAVNEH